MSGRWKEKKFSNLIFIKFHFKFIGADPAFKINELIRFFLF